MSKIILILSRELRMRVRKPSFWMLTLLVPVLLAVLYALPVIGAKQSAERTQVIVVDETGLFEDGLRSTLEVGFRPVADLPYAQRQLEDDPDVDAILFIPARETTLPSEAFLYYRSHTPSLAVQSVIDHQLQTVLRNAILEDVYNLPSDVYHSVESTHIRLTAHDAATGKESFVQVKTVAGIALGVLMALALLLFGMQVMRGVQEEKQTRVAEVMVTSVRPVELMVGKVGGVALTALIQLVLWCGLTAAAIAGVQAANPVLFAQARQQQAMHSIATKGAEATAQYENPVALVDQAVQGLTAVNLPLIAGVFFLFFLLGYLLYGSLLAAAAARGEGDSEALPITLLVCSPLLMVLVLAPFILRAPAGVLATVLTVVPFTTPVAVMLRLPFGLPAWQLWLGVILLTLCFIGAALIAARTYRRHILPRH